MTRFLPILSLLFCSCGSLVRYPNGRTALFTHSDAQDLSFTGPGVSFHARTLIHSVPTKAAVDSIGNALVKGGIGGAGAGLTGGAL